VGIHNRIHVKMDNDQALVSTASGRFHVCQRNSVNAVSSCPMHLVVGALGACIMLTLNAVAEHKEIDLGESDVRIDYVTAKSGGTRFMVDLKLDDRLTDRERKILFHSARLCDVGKVLKSDVAIDYRLLEDAETAATESTITRAAGGVGFRP